MKIHICFDSLGDNQLTFMLMKFGEQCLQNFLDPVFLIENKSKSRFIGDFVFFNFADYYQKSGKFILTSLSNYKLLDPFVGKIEKYFFVYEIPQIFNNNDMDTMDRLCADKTVKFGFRSEHQKKFFEYLYGNVNGQIIGELDFELVKQWI